MRNNRFRIISNRRYEKRQWWDIVYLWEDVLNNNDFFSIITIGKYQYLFERIKNRIYHYIPLAFSPKNLRFLMTGRTKVTGEFGKRDIPVIIDYFIDKEHTQEFLNTIKYQQLVLITSKEVYDHLIASGADSNIIKHWALSLPDKLSITPDTIYEKDYDLVLIGRLPNTFRDYLNEFTKKFPELRIVSRRVENGCNNYYDNHNHYMGNGDSYDGYINLLRRSKAYIYCTPGLDNDKSTNGFSQVTPRFLEALSSGCNLILHYPHNSDTEYYELAKFGKSIESYDEFENEMKKALSIQPDMKLRSTYLKKHYTSTRDAELKNILDEKFGEK